MIKYLDFYDFIWIITEKTVIMIPDPDAQSVPSLLKFSADEENS